MSFDSNDIQLGRIRGYLEAFALFNHKADHDFDFSLVELANAGSAEQSVQGRLMENPGIDPGSLKLVSLPKETTELHTALIRWLFNYLPENDHIYHLADPKGLFSFSNPQFRHSTVRDMVAMILEATQPIAVYKVSFHPIKWYECEWDDFVLENQERIFLLHLGVSD